MDRRFRQRGVESVLVPVLSYQGDVKLPDWMSAEENEPRSQYVRSPRSSETLSALLEMWPSIPPLLDEGSQSRSSKEALLHSMRRRALEEDCRSNQRNLGVARISVGSAICHQRGFPAEEV